MGLGIYVGEKRYYGHPYSALHLLREFAAKKEHPIVEYDTIYNVGKYNKYESLIIHPDEAGGYLPNGVQPPYELKEHSQDFGWQSSEKLLSELEDLGQYKEEMDEYVAQLYDELLAAAKASVQEGKPIEFH